MSGDQPIVTVVLPTYNRSNVLVYAIRTVLCQTYPNLELIVVGDGCTDDSGAVVQGFKDPRITWLDLPKGLGFGYENRNRALERARGTLIAYQQTDDLWFPDHLALLVSAILPDNFEVVYSRPIHVLQDGRLFQHPHDVRLPYYRDMLLRGDKRMATTNLMHRSSVVRDVGAWDGRIARGGDTEYLQRMLKGGKRFSYLPIPTALVFPASLRPNAYRDREEHEQRAYYEQIVADPGWVHNFRQRMAEDLERRFMEQEANLAARAAVIDELTAAVRAREADCAARLALIDELTAAVRAFETDRATLLNKLNRPNSPLLSRLLRRFRSWRVGAARASRRDIPRGELK